MTIHEILTEWSYRLDRGYPEMDNPYDILLLEQILKESNFNSRDIDVTIRNLQENIFGPKEEKEEITPEEDDNKDDDEVGQLRTQLGSHSKKDVTELINKMDLDEKQIQKLYHRISSFGSYKPILKSLRASFYKESEVKRYSQEIQMMIEDLDPKETTQFVEYLSNTKDQLEFPTDQTGNLFTIMPSDKVPKSVMLKIISHTTQDEGKRGVGMGEMGMALIFKNITDSDGKGDLALNKKEFEIKGNGATLGEKPEGFPVDMSKLEPFGIIRKGTTYEIGEGEDIEIVPNKNKFDEAIFKTHQKTKDKPGFEEALKDTLANDVGHGAAVVDELWPFIDFTTQETIHREIALMNVYRYVAKEEFDHFLAHDFGRMAGGNTGKYVYAGGSPSDICAGLRGVASFEKISWDNCRPRIGFSNLYLEEEE